MKRRILFIISCLICCLSFVAQDAEKKDDYDPKQEVVFDNKRYRVWNSYLTVGGLTGFNSQFPTSQFVGALDINFHIKKEYFQLGFFLSGNTFYDKNNVNVHAGWGKRIEKTRYNFAAFGGLCYSLYYPFNTDSNRIELEAKTDIGAYVAVQNYYKFKYDVGIGGTVFAEYSPGRFIYGIRIELYFSSAYRGEKGRRKISD